MAEWSKKELRLWLHYHNFLSKALMIVGASVLLIVVGIVPMIGKFNNTRQLLEKEKSKLEDLTKKVVIADNLDQNILEERVKLLNQVLPPTKDVVIYLNTLDSLAKELNLSLGDVSLSPGIIYEKEVEKSKSKKSNQVNEGWQVLETELRIVGSRDNIYKFLRQVEKIAPLMLVRDVQMSRIGSQLSETSFILTLKLGMVYAQPEFNKILKGEIKLLTREDERIISKIRDLKFYPLNFSGTNNNSGESYSRDNLFEPISGYSVRLKDQSDRLQEELPQPQLESSPQSSESSQSAQNQR